MKIINYLPNIILTVLLLNNGYTNEKIDNIINQFNNLNLSDKLVKFHNGGNRCGLAALNQIFSEFNPSNNEFLKKFSNTYYDISQNENQNKKIFDPKYIFEPLLNNITFIGNISEKDKKLYLADINKFLNSNEGSDVAERYNRLTNVLQHTQYNLQEINAFCELRNYKFSNNNNYIKLIQDGFDIGNPITNNTVNLIVNNNDITTLNFYKQIQSNTVLKLNNTNFNLSALIFLCVKPDGTPNKSGTHFIASKRLLNGKWRLIDSSHNERNQIYNNFNELMSTYVIPSNPKATIKNRLMPKLMLFTRNQNIIQNNINKQIQDLQNTIDENINLIHQISIANGYVDYKEILDFINNIKNNKEIFNKIIKLSSKNNEINDENNKCKKVEYKVIENKKTNNTKIEKHNIKNKYNDEIYDYFAKNNYGWLCEKALEIISTIFNLEHTQDVLKNFLVK